MNKINVYEYSGIICPGSVFLVGCSLIFSDITESLLDISIGEFGIFIIMAFCTGHIIQGIANFFEDVFGWPKRQTNNKLNSLFKKDYTEIFAILSQKDKTGRISIFNRLYGLMRGLCVSFLLLALLGWHMDISCTMLTLLITCCIICGYRAWHFSDLYKKELITMYKTIKKGH